MIFKNKRATLKITTLFMAMVMIAMVILPAAPAMAAQDNAAYNAKAEELIQNIYDKYMEDGKVGATSFTELDGFGIYVLNEAEVDVLSWEFEGTSVEEELDKLIGDAIAKEEANDTGTFNAKQLAFLFVAAESSNKTTEATKLLGFLKARQANSVNGGFVDGDYSEYTNLPVFDLLTSEGKLEILEKPEGAYEYVKDLKPTESDFPDFMSISQTARILKGFEVQLNKASVSAIVEPMIQWQKDNKEVDGSFNAGGGDAVTNTSEVLWTIDSIGITTTLTTADRDSALAYLIEKDSFGNIASNVWALKALLLNGAEPNIDPTGGSSGEVEINKVTIRIEGPDYTIVPETEVEINGAKSYSDILLDNALALGYTVQESEGFINSINNIPGESYWAVTPFQETYTDGDSFVFYAGGSGNLGEITLSKTTAEPGDRFTATVTADGKPVIGATVIYYTNGNMSSPTKVSKVTDVNGKVELTINGTGAYLVAANKINTSDWPDPDNGLIRTLPKRIYIERYEAPSVEEIRIDMAVIDDNGKAIYGPRYLTLKSDDRFGFTALGALHETGLRYDINYDNTFITSIDRIENVGLSGWMYAVNGKSPEVPAIDKELRNGDEVLWFYSKSSTTGVPSFPGDYKDEDNGLKQENDKEKDKDKDKDKDKEDKPIITPPRLTFTDVGANLSWAKEAIEALAARGIITGVGNNKFEPNLPITRAEFSKVIVEALEEDVVSGGTVMFSDVDSTKWYADYIGKAAAKGLIEGNEGKFRPDETITRNEVAVILHRMLNEVAPTNATLSFEDKATVPAWANDAVAYSVEKGLVKGYEDNTFKGQDPMSRAEVAVVLYRYIKMMNL